MTKKERTLSLDLALEYSGWAIWHGERAVKADFIRTTKKKATPTESARIASIYKVVEHLIDECDIDTIVIEDQYVSFNKKTAMKLSRVRGAIECLASLKGIKIVSYQASEIKKYTSGKGSSNKEDMYEAVVALRDEYVAEDVWQYIENLRKDNKKIDDIIDAIGIGYCYLQAPTVALPV